MVRPPCCDKVNVKKGLWTADEDAKILAYISKHGTGNWTSVPKRAGLRRCGKSCRLRWTNYLRPDLKHDNFTAQEEDMIIKLHAAIGSRWSLIAQQLPGRTDNDVKNYWNTKLRKKLKEMGIDPITHKPFSQILADYGIIGGTPQPVTRIGSLNMNTAFCMKLEEHRAQPEGFSNIIVSSKTEPVEHNLFHNNNHPLDLLRELQSITMVTQQSYLSLSSSSSSTSSPCSTTAQENQPLPFSWRDFLLEEAFVQAGDDQQEQEHMAELASKNFPTQMHNEIPHYEAAPNNGFQGSSSSSGSFVENLIDLENEMLLEFPNLMEEALYY